MKQFDIENKVLEINKLGEYLSIYQIVILIGCSDKTIRKWIKGKKLKSYRNKLNRNKYIIKRQDLIKFIRDNFQV